MMQYGEIAGRSYAVNCTKVSMCTKYNRAQEVELRGYRFEIVPLWIAREHPVLRITYDWERYLCIKIPDNFSREGSCPQHCTAVTTTWVYTLS